VAICTVVEFHWDAPEGRRAFEAAMEAVSAEAPPPTGRTSRIVGLTDMGAHVVEVWRTPEDARRLAAAAAPLLARVSFPAPASVHSFDVTSYEAS
jgi:hypothetical protein